MEPDLLGLIESRRHQENTQSRPRIPLLYRPTPTRSARANHPRTMPQVQEVLRAQLRKLIPGELPWPLYVWSKQPGTGKTSAALAMLDHCGPIVDPTWFSSDHARDAFAGFLDLTTLPRLVEQLARGMIKRADADFSGMTVTESQFWNQISRAKLIVIDDIRVPGQKEIKLGEDHYSVLKRILDERVQR